MRPAAQTSPGGRDDAALVLLAATGCVQMPESGPVVGTGSEGRADEPPGVFIDPKPPAPGANPADIVTGFLDAMTATPIQTNAAKQFLTTRRPGRVDSRRQRPSPTRRPPRRGAGCGSRSGWVAPDTSTGVAPTSVRFLPGSGH